MAADLWRHPPHTFRALRAVYGPLYVRCDTCRRYAPLPLAGIEDVDYRPITFSCSKCGGLAWMTITDPSQDAGMSDYRLDPVADPKHHPEAIKRMSGQSETSPRLGPKHFGVKKVGR